MSLPQNEHCQVAGRGGIGGADGAAEDDPSAGLGFFLGGLAVRSITSLLALRNTKLV
jgi:hypothetical protein